MTKLTIEHVTPSRLTPAPYNPRRLSDGAKAKLRRSIEEFGLVDPILARREDGLVLGGHQRLEVATELGLSAVPVVYLDGLDDQRAAALNVVLNNPSAQGAWDYDKLTELLSELDAEGFDATLTGFDDDELTQMLGGGETVTAEQADEVPELRPDPVTKPGDVWLLGKHRVMCGDSTVVTDVERLMAGARAALLHADPPYGMGKASDGVANDNIYNDDLDAFQMEWWATLRPFLLHNASAYIWGNAPDLWRLWYKAGLGYSETLELRNQIVWDKKNIAGMASPDLTQYATASEHCLFFALGEQYRGNVNTDEFPAEWEALRAYLEGEARAVSIGPAEIKDLCGVQMYGHWFSQSQFVLIPERHYKTLAAAHPGRFLRPWKQLKAEWDKVKSVPTRKIQEARSYFDNAHDVMRDVWEFSRVTGEERHGHATPKPVAMMERVMLSSLPKGGLCVEPFGGSGSTLMGAERTGRVCYAMELNPVYCDVIVKRWQEFTGKRATLEATGEPFPDDK